MWCHAHRTADAEGQLELEQRSNLGGAFLISTYGDKDRGLKWRWHILRMSTVTRLFGVLEHFVTNTLFCLFIHAYQITENK